MLRSRPAMRIRRQSNSRWTNNRHPGAGLLLPNHKRMVQYIYPGLIFLEYGGRQRLTANYRYVEESIGRKNEQPPS